jgi:repressor LexA
MTELTARQAEVLQLIADFLQATGFPPTRAEIAKQLGFRSANAAEDHLRALERKGYIEMLPGASRGIRLREGLGIPVVGRVAAGNPILAEQHIQGRFQVDPSLFKPRADYLLKVRGMSMRDAGIWMATCWPCTAPRKRARVKSWSPVWATKSRSSASSAKGNQVQLLPENPDFEPILVDLKRDFFAIEGIGVGIIRNGKAL